MQATRVKTGAILLGIGLGGFVDGIAFHQLLQWHAMLSAVVPPVGMEAMRLNMTADGLFHVVTWLTTFAGVLVLWSAVGAGARPMSTRAFGGYLLLGWGGFNLVEGLLNHHVLGLHHVRDLPVHVAYYDWLFLIVAGIGFVLAGFALRDGRSRIPVVDDRRTGHADRRAPAVRSSTLVP